MFNMLSEAPLLRRLWLIAALGALLMLLLSTGSDTASAHTFPGNGWKWSINQKILYLRYANLTGAYPDYSNAVAWGTGAWTATPTPIQFLTNDTDFPSVVLQTTFNGDTDDWGWTLIDEARSYCSAYEGGKCVRYTWEFRNLKDLKCINPCARDYSTNGWHYWRADITFNRASMNALDYHMKRKVAVHELGHALGLGHPPGDGYCESIMMQGTVNMELPKQHDIYDINRLYPSSYWPDGSWGFCDA